MLLVDTSPEKAERNVQDNHQKCLYYVRSCPSSDSSNIRCHDTQTDRYRHISPHSLLIQPGRVTDKQHCVTLTPRPNDTTTYSRTNCRERENFNLNFDLAKSPQIQFLQGLLSPSPLLTFSLCTDKILQKDAGWTAIRYAVAIAVSSGRKGDEEDGK